MRALAASSVLVYHVWLFSAPEGDSIDLGRLTEDQRAKVFKAFAPEKTMQLYDRGIRRRLAPMLHVLPVPKTSETSSDTPPSSPVRLIRGK